MPKRENEDAEQEPIVKRKESHLRIPVNEDVEARETSTYLEYVHLIHNALPELNVEEIDTSCSFLGHKFAAPLFIDAMTGGTPLAAALNQTFAEVAEEFGLGMAVGSQRAGLKSEEAAETYAIARKSAPTIFLAANIGGAQLARDLTVADAQKLIEMIGANALVVHLNPLQELIQPEGQPQFKGVLAKLRELSTQLKVPVIIKEVGAGISKEVAVRAELAGVAGINVAGSGGTSWAGVEQIRATARREEAKAELGLLFWDWGIPTAAAILEVRRAVRLPLIASGGLRNGLDIAKSLVLGADLGGMALPMLKAASKSKEELRRFVGKTIQELKATMFLVGAVNVAALKKTRHLLKGPLAEWVKQLAA